MITRRNSLALLAASGLLSMPGLARAQAPAKKIAVVAKIGGIPWFNAMEVGIKRAGAETGTEAWMIGPTQADAAQQVAAIEDLIARKVDVIAVVPNDADALVPVFQRAHAAGIRILTHESPLQQGNDWDMEFTSAQADGERHLEALAQAMGGVGQYIIIVGSLTVPQHRMRADAAVALQKAKYPKMELVGDRFGVGESLDDSYRTVLDQIRAHPQLRGVVAFGSQGPIGAARAVDERGKIGKISVIGPFSPGQGAKYVRSGAITMGYIWNPLLAGETIVRIGALMANGKPITNGLVLPEVGAITIDPTTRVIMANKMQAINKETIASLVALGL